MSFRSCGITLKKKKKAFDSTLESLSLLIFDLSNRVILESAREVPDVCV